MKIFKKKRWATRKELEERSNDGNFMIHIWQWIAILAFVAGFTLSAGIYSEKVNTQVQEHIDNVNEYMLKKYGYDSYLDMYLNQNKNNFLNNNISYNEEWQ